MQAPHGLVLLLGIWNVMPVPPQKLRLGALTLASGKLGQPS